MIPGGIDDFVGGVGSFVGGPPTEEAAGATEVIFQNQLHQIQDGIVAQTASGLNGVLVA